MSSAGCPHQLPVNDDSLCATDSRCGLAERILGTGDRCRVSSATCAQCATLTPSSAARPNSVVASIVYDVGRRRASEAAVDDPGVGCAFQAAHYAFFHLSADAKCLPADSKLAPASDFLVRFQRPANRWTRLFPRRRKPVGLVGYNCASGLGYLARDLATNGVVDDWLILPHPRYPTLSLPPGISCGIEYSPAIPVPRQLRRWLAAHDWVVFLETPGIEGLAHMARDCGARVALVPMWEMTSPAWEWLRTVDLAICPTRHTTRTFSEWKARFGFGWDIEELAWPLALNRFPYRERERCERFLFVNGTGGTEAWRLDGSPFRRRRKGLDLILEAARLAPEIPWTVCSQENDRGRWPGNVTRIDPPADNALLYAEGDVCVQPSRWEGLGLPLLECQATGLPLVTTDQAPMNEHHPYRRLSPRRNEWGYVHEGAPFPVPDVDPATIVETVRALFGTDIRAASRAARAFVEREHNWELAATKLRDMFTSRIANAGK